MHATRPAAALAVMAKKPVPGWTKTRLLPPLLPQQAADLYEALLRDTLERMSGLGAVQLAVGITPAEALPYFREVSPRGSLLLPVQGEDIGVCLEQVLAELLARGFAKALALNSDGPSLPLGHVQQAVNALDRADLVLGPSEDGGYYLIGLRSVQPQLFRGIDWSTDRVTMQTLQRAEELGWQVSLLPSWYDIDTPDDLARLERELGNLPLNALPNTRRCLDMLRRGC